MPIFIHLKHKKSEKLYCECLVKENIDEESKVKLKH